MLQQRVYWGTRTEGQRHPGRSWQRSSQAPCHTRLRALDETPSDHSKPAETCEVTFPFSFLFPGHLSISPPHKWLTSPPLTCSFDTLIHSPYLDMLPSPDKLRMPLHFTDDELDALKGTNLHGATIDRRCNWQVVKWEPCHADISSVNMEWGRAPTWYVFTFRVPPCPPCSHDRDDLHVLTHVFFDSPLTFTLPHPAA